MTETIEKAAATYANAVHEAVHGGGKDHVQERFKSVEAFVAFEMDGDASDKADRMAERFGVPAEDARTVLEAALSAVDLGYLNAVWREEWIEAALAAMAEQDAVAFYEQCYEDEDFDPDGAADWAAEAFGRDLGAALKTAGFDDEVTRGDRVTYEDTLATHVSALVDGRDRYEVEEIVKPIASEHFDQLHAAMMEAVEERAPGAMKRLGNEFELSGILWDAVDTAWHER